MKIYKKQNVYDAALERINWIFDEFPNVVIGFSGGKDSTVCFNLALKVAKERNRLPLKVMFIDQEAEWDCVINYVRRIMNMKEVEPVWLQVPFRLHNATSTKEPWLHCWKEGAKWLREKEDIAIRENIFGTDRFKGMFGAVLKTLYPETKTCYIAGVRTEESPGRYMGCTANATYKWATWGNANNPPLHYSLYAIYDWSYTDVWKCIHDNGWDYCRLYDYMYQYGVPVHNMRVSNVHHETAVRSLYYMQEIEPDNWSRLTARVGGINSAGQMKEGAFNIPELPDVFNDWKEYRDYLLENLVTDPERREVFRKEFNRMDKTYGSINYVDEMYRIHIKSMLVNDHEFTKIINWERSPEVREWFRIYVQGKEVDGYALKNKYIMGRKNEKPKRKNKTGIQVD